MLDGVVLGCSKRFWAGLDGSYGVQAALDESWAVQRALRCLGCPERAGLVSACLVWPRLASRNDSPARLKELQKNPRAPRRSRKESPARLEEAEENPLGLRAYSGSRSCLGSRGESSPRSRHVVFEADGPCKPYPKPAIPEFQALQSRSRQDVGGGDLRSTQDLEIKI